MNADVVLEGGGAQKEPEVMHVGWVHTVVCDFPGCRTAAPRGHFEGEMSLCYDHRQQLFYDAGDFYDRWEQGNLPTMAV